ncbi:MAG: NADAR domain-containing protein [Candidatus Obscuribacterales bacterium]
MLFYGHKASTDGSITASCCSQWFPAPFTIDRVEYLNAEHWDRIWGIGMAQSNAKARDPKQWNGQNLLGFALMQVRDQLS